VKRSIRRRPQRAFLPALIAGLALLVGVLPAGGAQAQSPGPTLEDPRLHLGTLVGAVAYFRSDISRLAQAAIGGPRGRDRRLAWLIVLSAVPAAIGGALLADTIENNTDQVWLVAVMLIVGALALAWADGVWRAPRNPDSGSCYDSLKGSGGYGVEANEVHGDLQG
jgi:uncharacterized membrane protein YhaH (DUF805 family)